MCILCPVPCVRMCVYIVCEDVCVCLQESYYLVSRQTVFERDSKLAM